MNKEEQAKASHTHLSMRAPQTSTESGYTGSMQQFAARIKFLQLLPPDLASRLDVSEFYFPQGRVEALRKQLEQTLQCYIMTYRADVFNRHEPIERHLCANLQGARLSDAQVVFLQASEQRIRRQYGVSFVAYAKPLVIIEPSKSPFYCNEFVEHSAGDDFLCGATPPGGAWPKEIASL